ncbi:MAG: cation:proton antiporter [Gemmatimonadetes bacterium]|nr:cation:proton antiporter [Gemmatimonadota bacterium]
MFDTPEAEYGLLVIGLFIVPRLLQRYRLPAAIVTLGLGMFSGMYLDLFHNDAIIQLFSTMGIVSLFLFAGLEVDVVELRDGIGILTQHVVIQVLLLTVGIIFCTFVFGLAPRPAALYSLALLTPSTGFILDSLPSFGLDKTGQFWVRSKAIATELVALALLLVVVQSTSAKGLGISLLAIFLMIAVLPSVFRSFARIIAPYAPGTEFTFLILVALVCAYITRRLGVYYLVGAFVVGLSAVRVRREVPSLSSEKLLAGVQLFASFFIPFYFFKAGLSLDREVFTTFSILTGIVMAAVLVPLKTLQVALHRRVTLQESWRAGAHVGLALVPTLVFTLVIGNILRQQFQLSDSLYGAMVVFTIINTMIPGIILHTPPLQFEAPTIPEAPVAIPDAISSAHDARTPTKRSEQ